MERFCSFKKDLKSVCSSICNKYPETKNHVDLLRRELGAKYPEPIAAHKVESSRPHANDLFERVGKQC